MELLQFVYSVGGIGGVLAFLMFMAYRYLVRQMREDRKYMEDRLTIILKGYNSSIRKNTKVLAELITWLKAKNGGK